MVASRQTIPVGFNPLSAARFPQHPPSFYLPSELASPADKSAAAFDKEGEQNETPRPPNGAFCFVDLVGRFTAWGTSRCG